MVRPSGVLFGTPDRAKGPKVRGASGRHCDFPGCTTVLSTYNTSSSCWLHTVPSPHHAPHKA
jgi:hypothetical protein